MFTVRVMAFAARLMKLQFLVGNEPFKIVHPSPPRHCEYLISHNGMLVAETIDPSEMSSSGSSPKHSAALLMNG